MQHYEYREASSPGLKSEKTRLRMLKDVSELMKDEANDQHKS